MNLLETSLKVLKKIGKPLVDDQDILNVVCKNNVKYLDYKYNAQWTFHLPFLRKRANEFIKMYPQKYKEFQNALDNFKILHYVSGTKPWTKKDLIKFENGYKNFCSKRPTLTYNPIYIKITK